MIKTGLTSVKCWEEHSVPSGQLHLTSFQTHVTLDRWLHFYGYSTWATFLLSVVEQEIVYFLTNAALTAVWCEVLFMRLYFKHKMQNCLCILEGPCQMCESW